MKARVFLFALLPLYLSAQTVFLKDTLRILCLGDSYTIGQSVSATGRWPSQLRDSLVQQNFVVDTVAIIATTGWRTDQLLSAISGKQLDHYRFNLVSLSIGVNNQYQGKPFSQYGSEFPDLLDSALYIVKGNKEQVFVLSIPDYAYTPFGQGGDTTQISSEINQYNAYNKFISDTTGVAYVDVTPVSRQGLQHPSYVAGDGLHPSAEQYAIWVSLMLHHMHREVLTGISAIQNSTIECILSPNPAQNKVTVKTSTGLDISSLEIYTARGELLQELHDPGNRILVDVSGFAPGLYYCRLNNGDRYFLKKLVVSH